MLTSFMLAMAPIILGAGIVWLIAPNKMEEMIAGILPRVSSDPSNAILCGSMVLAILILWPWKKDSRVYFRDFRDDCSPKNNRCHRNYSGVCQEKDCPRMKGNSDA